MVDALTTIARVKALSRSLSSAAAADDALITSLIASTSMQVEEFLGRGLIYKSRTALFDVEAGVKRYYLQGYPDISLEYVKFDPDGVFGSDTIVDPSNYVIDRGAGAVVLKYAYTTDYPQALKITYDGGFSADAENAEALVDLAPTIAIAVEKQVIIEYNKRTQGASSYSVHGSSMSFDQAPANRGMSSDVYDLLLPFRTSPLILRK